MKELLSVDEAAERLDVPWDGRLGVFRFSLVFEDHVAGVAGVTEDFTTFARSASSFFFWPLRLISVLT